jgi:hypothetical protein
MAGWDIRIDSNNSHTFAVGERVEAEPMFISEKLNGEEEARFRLPNTSANRALLVADHWCQIMFSNTIIFTGMIKGYVQTQQWLDVIVYNIVFEKAKRTLYGDPDAVPVEGDFSTGDWSDTVIMEDIVVTVLSYLRGAGAAHTDIEVKFDYTTCYHAMRYIAQATGQDIWTGAVNNRGTTPTTVFLGTRGTDKSGAISITPAVTSTTSKKVNNRALTRDKVFVLGYDADGNRIVPVSAGAGSNEIAYRKRGIYDATALTALATEFRTNLNTESQGTKLTVPITEGYLIYPGDTIELTANAELGITLGDYRVLSTKKMNTTADITIDKTTVEQDDLFASLRSLEDIGIYAGGTLDQLPLSAQKFNTNCTFSALDYRDAGWAEFTIEFDNGFNDTVLIGTLAGINGGVLGADTYYVYYTKNDNTLNIVNDAGYTSVLGGANVVLAKITVGAETDQFVAIEAYGTAGSNISYDLLGGNAIKGDIQSIELRKWTSDLSFIWDEATPDYQKIQWGQDGNEGPIGGGGVDGSIKFADGNTRLVECDELDPHPTGTYYYYWDITQVNGDDDFELQKNTDHALAIGEGKGLIAIVEVSTTSPPTLLPVDSYTPVIGTGIISAYAIESTKITTKSIYGKDIATDEDVGIVGGAAGVRIVGVGSDIVGTAIGDAVGGNFTAGIYGFTAGPIRTFNIASGDGIFRTYGVGSFAINDAIASGGAQIGTLNGTTFGGRPTIRLLADAGGAKDVVLEAGGHYIWVRGDGRIDMVVNGDIDIGAQAVLDVQGARLLLPNGAPGAPRNFEVWWV